MGEQGTTGLVDASLVLDYLEGSVQGLRWTYVAVLWPDGVVFCLPILALRTHRLSQEMRFPL